MGKKRLSASERFLYPVPCILVTCGKKNPNIVTIACTGIICSDPPQVYISIRPTRHSYGIIKKEGIFGINMPTASMVDKVDICGTVSGKNADKFKLCNFSVFYGEVTGVPLIMECPINIECEVINELPCGVHNMFIGKVVNIYADENYKPTIDSLQPIAFLPFSSEYSTLGEVVGRYGFSKKK
jgi:flavin reductase (DIM6/NTAB) family NADH-FMN oxidoreductase RutF